MADLMTISWTKSVVQVPVTVIVTRTAPSGSAGLWVNATEVVQESPSEPPRVTTTVELFSQPKKPPLRQRSAVPVRAYNPFLLAFVPTVDVMTSNEIKTARLSGIENE